MVSSAKDFPHSRKEKSGGWGIKCIHRGGTHFMDPPDTDVFSFPLVGPLHRPRGSSLRNASGSLDDVSLRRRAVAKGLGKVFCMGIRVCLFEGAHLTSSLSRSNGGDGGGLLKAVCQTFSSRAAHSSTRVKQGRNSHVEYLILHLCFSGVLHFWPYVFKHEHSL